MIMTITLELWWIFPILSILAGIIGAEAIWRYHPDPIISPIYCLITSLIGILLGVGTFIGHFL